MQIQGFRYRKQLLGGSAVHGEHEAGERSVGSSVGTNPIPKNGAKPHGRRELGVIYLQHSTGKKELVRTAKATVPSAAYSLMAGSCLMRAGAKSACSPARTFCPNMHRYRSAGKKKLKIAMIIIFKKGKPIPGVSVPKLINRGFIYPDTTALGDWSSPL